MPNATPSHLEIAFNSTDVEAEVLFVDLDETILDGTVSRMTDEELSASRLIGQTLQKIAQAQILCIPVVMVTRNSQKAIDRFFEFHPEMKMCFSETLAVEMGRKSEAINHYLRQNHIQIKKAAFIDDTAGERDDVERNTEGVCSRDPDEAFSITTVKKDVVREKREKLLKRFKNTPHPDERKRIKAILESRFQMETHEIYLAA
ncbi:hypothetical protein JW752_01265 [Candidatus Peregrinibacteria bacterium]|nr:hypothetical protein [Candidatus Peregrinibacteria bacterium]